MGEADLGHVVGALQDLKESVDALVGNRAGDCGQLVTPQLVTPQKAGHIRAVKGGFLFEGYSGISSGETVYVPTLDALFAEIRAFFDDAK